MAILASRLGAPYLIVQTARDLIASKGFGAMSMRELAKQVGIHAGSIYSHFQSKEEVLEEVLDTMFCDWLQQWRYCRPDVADPMVLLEAFIGLHLSHTLMANSEEIRIVSELRHLGKNCRNRIIQRRVLYENELESIILLGERSGVFRVADSALACQTVFALMDGFAQRSYTQQHPADGVSAQMIRNMIYLLLGRQSWVSNVYSMS